MLLELLTRGLIFPTLLLLVLELLYLIIADLVSSGPFRLNTLTRGDCGDDGLLILTESFSDGSRMVNIP